MMFLKVTKLAYIVSMVVNVVTSFRCDLASDGCNNSTLIWPDTTQFCTA